MMAGRAVVGEEVPGFAVAGEPAPIGEFRPRLAGLSRPGAPGIRDNSVMPTSVASDPVPQPHNRPHILTHLFGLDAIGNERAEAKERKTRESHASIAYGATVAPVNDLPASVVYGKGR